MMLANPETQSNANSTRNNSTRSLFGNSSHDGYGGLEVYDITRPYGVYDTMPSFPGANNHMSLGANAGMLTFGATPGR